MFFLDPTYIMFMLPGLLLTLLAQLWVNSTYSRWSKVENRSRMNGAQAADRMLTSAGMSDVSLEPSEGRLSDHYDPRSRTLRLSRAVGEGQSVASLAIAAHEVGHAVQDQKGYLPMRLRGALVPAVSIGSNLGIWLIMGGLLLRSLLGTEFAVQIAWLGVYLFAGGAIFALATLPVELNASQRARALLKSSNLIQSGQEQRGVSAVLTAAAFTYVAGLATAILQLLYFISLVSRLGGRRR
jgi:Zn-dependent membrane protease YugP